MALASGTRVGGFEVIALLGAGGMGEVYRARDARLQRDVALKILPEHLTSDPERLARFQREAQVLASLAHSNIAQIYAIEETPAASGGTRALVLELVEGPTLADRIARGPLPLDEVVAIGKQIADALDAAHEQGIVHRDLKPANIKLRDDGTVKVLDFGLAKLGTDAAEPSSFGTLSPTLSMAFTEAGMILGTAAYMAPEQARGRKVDKRVDVWAFGCVLFEMLCGSKAFDGTDATEMIAAVVRGEPSWSALPAETPPALVMLLRRCLQKDPRQRLRDIADARYELEHASTPVSTTAAVPPLRTRRLAFAWGAGALALALAAGVGAWFLKPQPERALRVFEIPLPPGQRFTFPGRHMVAISPQGHVAYSAENRIYLRRRDQVAASAVAEMAGSGLAGAPRNPFFSPDGEWLGFWAANELRKVALTGGAPLKLTSAENPWGVWWGTDGTILYGQGPEGIYRVSENGGVGQQIIKVTPPESAHGPQLLPDGRTVLFTLAPQTVGVWNKARIVAQSLDSGTRTEILAGGTDARYLPTGHLVYSLNGSLLAVPFDASRLTRTGGPVALIEGLAQTNVGQTGAAQFSLSPDGTLAYIAQSDETTGAARRGLAWFDRKGASTSLTNPESRAYRYLELSHDGTRVVFDALDSNRDIFILSLSSGAITPLTFEPVVEQAPIWSPDDEQVIYASSREGPPNIFRRAANGSGSEERLTTSKNAQIPQAVTPDGQLIFLEVLSGGNDDLMIMRLDGDRKPRPLLATNYRERNAVLSPNGRWLAYQSDKSGREEVWITPFPALDKGQWKASPAGGTRPNWVSNSELAFVEEDSGQLLSVAVRESGDVLAVDPPAVILNRLDPVTLFALGRTYDFSKDGQRILAPTTAPSGTKDSEPTPRVILVQHWIEDLRKRVFAK